MAREKKLSPGELGPPWTVLKLLRWTAGFFEEEGVTETPRLDADLLLGHVLDFDRIELYTQTETIVDDEPRQTFRQLVKRRAAGEPVAYLVGTRSFWQLELDTDDRALIPRPETEVLVERALELLAEGEPKRVVDVGTGTGAVALALASERPAIRVAATDLSADALALARQNVEKAGLDEQIALYQGDLLDALPAASKPVDLIVSNPPYVPEASRDDVMVDVRDFEPEDALFAGPEGLSVLRRLIKQAADRLVDGGWLAVEIGHQQGEAVADLFADAGFQEVDIRQDYGDRDRVVSGHT